MDIIIHEYAHYITFRLYGLVQAHGPEWKSVMEKLGAKEISARTAVFSSIKKKPTDVQVKCNCSKIYISSYKANKIKNGFNYKCRNCQSRVKIV